MSRAAKRLFFRELKRLAPAAGGIYALGILILLMLFAMSAVMAWTAMYTEVVFPVVWVGAPWLLAVVAFGPDMETGGEHFLGTLPVSRWTLLLVRGAAAVFWTFVVLVAFTITYALTVETTSLIRIGDDEVFAGLLMLAYPLACGTLAAAVARRTLVAFITAPLFLIPLLIFLKAAEGLGAPWGLDDLMWGLFVVPVGILAVHTYVKAAPADRSVKRPLVVAGVVLFGMVLISGGATTVAYAYDRVFPSYKTAAISARSPDGRKVTMLVYEQTHFNWRDQLAGYSSYTTQRFALLDGLAPEKRRTFPLETQPRAFSPDGTLILAENWEQERWELFETDDLRSRGLGAKFVRDQNKRYFPNYWAMEHAYTWLGARYLGFGQAPFVWSDGSPFLIGAKGLVSWDGKEELPLRGAIESATAGRVLLRLADGRREVWDLSGDRRGFRALNPPTGTYEMAFADHSARWLVALADGGGAPRLWARALDASERWVELELPLAEFYGRADHRSLLRATVEIAARPGGSEAMVTVNTRLREWEDRSWATQPQSWLVDFGRGTATEIPGAVAKANAVWSPAGTVFMTAVGSWRLDAPTPWFDDMSLFRNRHAPYAFVDETSVVSWTEGVVPLRVRPN